MILSFDFLDSAVRIIKNALELIEKIQLKLEDLDNQKYLKIKEENRSKREHELNLARIAAEKEISKVGN